MSKGSKQRPTKVSRKESDLRWEYLTASADRKKAILNEIKSLPKSC